jgi:hypothetical protein
VAARFGVDHLMGDMQRAARSDATARATPATGLLRRPRVLPVPAYMLGLRVASVSKYQLGIRPRLPWHQGTTQVAVIARMKFSRAERVRITYGPPDRGAYEFVDDGILAAPTNFKVQSWPGSCGLEEGGEPCRAWISSLTGATQAGHHGRRGELMVKERKE